MAGLDYARNGNRIRADGIDHLGILILFNGSQDGDAEGRSLACGGGVVLADLGRPSHWTSTASRSMTFAIPRAVAEEVLPPVRLLHGLVLGADRAQPLIDHVRALAPHLLGLPVTSGPALVRAFLHMLALVLDRPAVPEVEGETRAVLGLALRRRAEMLLEQHFHDPAFGVQELAGLLGLSRSALYRLLNRAAASRSSSATGGCSGCAPRWPIPPIIAALRKRPMPAVSRIRPSSFAPSGAPTG